MKAKRQRPQAAFKAKVGLEALAEIKTVAEIAREYQVHPTQVSQWKRAMVERLSMDGRGRWMDNRFVERLWRSLKYEDIYLRGDEHGRELRQGVGNWFGHYNDYRPHQALDYTTPAAVYRAPESHGAKPASWA